MSLLQQTVQANIYRSILGFPRMGVNRDLKKATEAYWAGNLSQKDLLAEGKRLRQEHWKIQKDAGVDIIPSNDFSFYDHVLDHIQLFGVNLPVYCRECLVLNAPLGYTTKVYPAQPGPDR